MSTYTVLLASRKEANEAKRATSLTSRLKQSSPTAAAAAVTSVPEPISPAIIPVTSKPEPSKIPRKNASRRLPPKRAASDAKSFNASLQSAADTLDDLFQVIPDQVSAQNDSWDKGLETIKKSSQSSAKPKKPVSGASWSPKDGFRRSSGAVKPTRLADNNIRARVPEEDYDDEKAEAARIAAETSEDYEGVEEFDEDDDTVIGRVSLLQPRRGQTVQKWYEEILQQNREPMGPKFITPDIDLSPDFHNLFGVDRAQQRNIVISNLGALRRKLPEMRPAVKKGKVEYQYRKMLERFGGDYSRLQANLVPTDLRRMRPSQVALLAMSRQTEASQAQRKKFGQVISSTLKDIDTVAVQQKEAT